MAASKKRSSKKTATVAAHKQVVVPQGPLATGLVVVFTVLSVLFFMLAMYRYGLGL